MRYFDFLLWKLSFDNRLSRSRGSRGSFIKARVILSLFCLVGNLVCLIKVLPLFLIH